MTNETDQWQLPIGVFDSGLGGLTVVAEMQRCMPNEDIIYLGDSARVPYGTRSPDTVRRYAWNCSRFLVDRGLKMLVVACNTVSALAIGALSEGLEVPVLGVIRAGARAAMKHPGVGRIGVIGTAGTVQSGAYVRELSQLARDVQVFQNPAPLLVPLVEEGWIVGDVPHLAVRRYIAPLVEKRVEVLLLGCTHYPVLRPVIEEEMRALNSTAVVVDSATSMAREVYDALAEQNLLSRRNDNGTLQCCVTDLPGNFGESAGRFLGRSVGHVEKVDIS